MQNGYPASALTCLADLLEGCEARWVVGGSTGLVLRGAKLDRSPRDLDIYADLASIPAIHERLAAYALDGPEPNETARYRSVLSHYRMEETLVELVGNFQVSAPGSNYVTEVDRFLFPEGDSASITARGQTVRLVPLGHELVFNLLRERMDRAIVAGALIAQNPSRHLPVLLALLERNTLSGEIVEKARALAGAERSRGGLPEEEPQDG